MTPRASVSALFLANGFIIGSWAAMIPGFAHRLDLSEGDVGVMIAIFGLGSLVVMPLTGITIARFGTETITRLLSLIAALALLWVALAPNSFVAACSLFAFGGAIAGMDVAMNAVAVDVEREHSAPIMSSCHGFWSLGGLAGALSAGYLLEHSGLYFHASFATVAVTALIVPALWYLPQAMQHSPESRGAIQFPRTWLPYLIGLAALCSAMPEGAVIDWSALYLKQELAANTFKASTAFGAFSATMAIVRFFGDPIRSRFGAVRTVQACSMVACIGLLIAGLAPTANWAIAGFLIAGLGMSNLVPIAFSAAGNAPGLAPGIGLSVATTIGYSGVLVAPALFGHVAEWLSFSFVFTALGGAMILVAVLSNIMRFADRAARPSEA